MKRSHLSAALLSAGILVPIFIVVAALQRSAFAGTAEDGGDIGEIRDRLAIQEKLLHAYAYAWDSKDCGSWTSLFTEDGLYDGSVTVKVTGRSALLQYCMTRQKDVLANVKTRHNVTNVVFDRLTPTQAEVRTYVFLTWRKPSDPAPVPQQAITYRDVIVKQNGRWLFKERHLTND
jgi:hypothetical protein